MMNELIKQNMKPQPNLFATKQMKLTTLLCWGLVAIHKEEA